MAVSCHHTERAGPVSVNVAPNARRRQQALIREWTSIDPGARGRSLAAERLLSAGFERHEALHMIGAAVAEQLWAAQMAGASTDPAHCLAALDALPDEDVDDLEAPAPEDLDLSTDEIDVADEEAFDDTVEWLLASYRWWLSDKDLDDEDWVAYQVLHHKWGTSTARR